MGVLARSDDLRGREAGWRVSGSRVPRSDPPPLCALHGAAVSGRSRSAPRPHTPTALRPAAQSAGSVAEGDPDLAPLRQRESGWRVGGSSVSRADPRPLLGDMPYEDAEKLRRHYQFRGGLEVWQGHFGARGGESASASGEHPRPSSPAASQSRRSRSAPRSRATPQPVAPPAVAPATGSRRTRSRPREPSVRPRDAAETRGAAPPPQLPGSSELRYANGDVYTGQLQQGRRHGQGTLQIAGGGCYTGEWVDDAPSGKGVREWPDGGRYQGTWRDGRPHGSGRLTTAGGEEYDGQWSRGQRHGDGAERKANGTIVIGSWERDALCVARYEVEGGIVYRCAVNGAHRAPASADESRKVHSICPLLGGRRRSGSHGRPRRPDHGGGAADGPPQPGGQAAAPLRFAQPAAAPPAQQQQQQQPVGAPLPEVSVIQVREPQRAPSGARRSPPPRTRSSSPSSGRQSPPRGRTSGRSSPRSRGSSPPPAAAAATTSSGTPSPPPPAEQRPAEDTSLQAAGPAGAIASRGPGAGAEGRGSPRSSRGRAAERADGRTSPTRGGSPKRGSSPHRGLRLDHAAASVGPEAAAQLLPGDRILVQRQGGDWRTATVISAGGRGGPVVRCDGESAICPAADWAPLPGVPRRGTGSPVQLAPPQQLSPAGSPRSPGYPGSPSSRLGAHTAAYRGRASPAADASSPIPQPDPRHPSPTPPPGVAGAPADPRQAPSLGSPVPPASCGSPRQPAAARAAQPRVAVPQPRDPSGSGGAGVGSPHSVSFISTVSAASFLYDDPLRGSPLRRKVRESAQAPQQLQPGPTAQPGRGPRLVLSGAGRPRGYSGADADGLPVARGGSAATSGGLRPPFGGRDCITALQAVFQRSSAKGLSAASVSRREFVAALRRDAAALRLLQQGAYECALSSGVGPRRAQREAERALPFLSDVILQGNAQVTWGEIESIAQQALRGGSAGERSAPAAEQLTPDAAMRSIASVGTPASTGGVSPSPSPRPLPPGSLGAARAGRR